MKLKKEYLLLAGVIAALVVYVSLHKTDRIHYDLPDLNSLKASEITSISVKGPENAMELKKESDKWLIYPEKYPADSTKVAPMVDAVTDLKVTALVSDSGSYERYDLGQEKAISVQAGSGGETLRAFDIGKTAPSSRHTFIKLQDDPNVYHARGNFRNSFETNVDDLRDKTVLAFEPEEIRQIDITRDGETRRFFLKAAPADTDAAPSDEAAAKNPQDQPEPPEKMVWQDEAGAMVDETAVQELLDSVASLKCREFINDKTKGDFTDPIYALQLTSGEDKVATLSIFAKQGEDAVGYPAVSSGSSYPFLLSSGLADTIMELFQQTPQPEE